MNHIDQLISNMCPDGVETKNLGDCVEILDSLRRPVTRSDRTAGVFPYFGANGIQDHVDDYLFDGVHLLVGEDGSVINPDGSPMLTWAVGKIWVNNHAHVLSERSDVALLRYLYFALQVVDVAGIVRGVPPKLNQKNLREIMIPVPPLEVQRAIVEILDDFNNLEAELKAKLDAELEARRKQYTHYRDRLLMSHVSTRPGVSLMALGDASIMKRGTYVTQKQMTPGDIPVILGGQEPAYYCDISNHDGEAIVMSRSGAYAGFVSFWDQPIFVTDGFILESNEWTNLRYLFHVLKNMQDSLHSMKRGAGVPHVRGEEVMKLEIPVVPLPEQERIVSILDRFDALVNDISIGLPAELAARRKQYEYYRDKLLTFKEAA